MLYRHFPKIANKEFSILTPSLAGVDDPALLAELLASAADLGINLIYAGSDPARAAFIKETAQKAAPGYQFSFVVKCTARDGAGLSEFLEKSGAGADDLVALTATGEIAQAAARAKASLRIAGYGFSAPTELAPEGGETCDPAAVIAAIEAHHGWDFCAIPLNYLSDGLDAAIARAAEEEISIVSTDPLAGGRLQSVPPEVHEFFRNAPVPRAHDEWALRAVWELQEVATVALPTLTKDVLVREAIYAEAGRANSLPSRELSVIKAAARAILKKN